MKSRSRVAAVLGVPSVIVGLTVVAFGTSSPELFVSCKFNFENLADMAVEIVVFMCSVRAVTHGTK